jgi:hypothetical protein
LLVQYYLLLSDPVTLPDFSGYGIHLQVTEVQMSEGIDQLPYRCRFSLPIGLELLQQVA